MEKKTHSQLELFSQGKDYSDIKIQTPRHSFLRQIRNYEKTILAIIGFVIAAIISFSLGVERGKKMQLIKTDSYLDVAFKTQPMTPTKTVSSPANNKTQFNEVNLENTLTKTRSQSTIEKQNIIKEPALQEPIHNYTIQVASYRSKTLAQKEVKALKKKGVMPLVLSKGKYIVVCVGNFSNKKMAESLLSELKKRYGDCVIRRL